MSPALRFLLGLSGFWLAAFALLRSTWVESQWLVPLAELQMRIAQWYGASARVPVSAVASCSGADVMALCTGAILAFPSPWRRRLTGIAGGLALILLVNTIRVGTLVASADSRPLFDRLHLQVWPIALVALVTVYVYAWIRRGESSAAPPEARDGEAPAFAARSFMLAAAIGLLAFGAAAPWLMTSELVLRAGAAVASAAAFVLGGVGLTAAASGNLLTTGRGAFLVTQECIATPVIAIYAAAVWTWAKGGRSRALLLLAAVPLFALLAVLRVLVVTLPGFLIGGSPLVAMHGFFQFLVAIVLVVVAGLWARAATEPGRGRRAAAAVGLGLLVALVAGPLYSQLVVRGAASLSSLAPHVLTELQQPGDPQGALLVLPAFQIALLAALFVSLGGGLSWRVGAAFAAVFVSQVALLVGLGELAAHGGVEPHALALRGWAFAAPIALALVVFHMETRRRSPRNADA